MDWLELLAPTAAILALFVAVGLAVQSVRQGRVIRRLQEQVANGGGVAARESLDRIQQLQTRAATSQGGLKPPGRGLRVALPVAVGVLILCLIGGGVWFLFFRGDGSSGSATPAAAVRPAASRPLPPQSFRVPAHPAPLDNKAAYTIAILNGSGVTGAARGRIQPLVIQAGYTPGNIDDAPSSDVRRSVVLFVSPKRADRNVAYNVAHDLRITQARRIDGNIKSLIGPADAVVIVGKDLANR
jgi:hypothetical protein